MATEQQLHQRVFDALADDLWIKRRLELGPVLSELEAILKDPKSGPDTKARASDWQKFVQFLAIECSGLQFSDDKQWSELMNLMEISRRFNHKSVKFRELLKNKQIIEMNAKQIRQLNESARLVHSIDQSLEELELLVHNCKLEMAASTNESNPTSERPLCDRISESEKYLRNRCEPLVYNLKLELDNKLISKHSQLDHWRLSVENLQKSIKLMSEFLEDFREFQAVLDHLRPLVKSVESESGHIGGNPPNSSNEQLLQANLSSCSRMFRRVVRYNEEELLKSLSAAPTSQRAPKKTLPKRPTDHQEQKQQVILLSKKILDAKRSPEFSSYVYSVKLRGALEEARKCASQLDEVMQTLRLEFGRFYFVSDVELLTIIALDSRLVTSGGDNELLVRKLFNNSISKFLLDERGENIVGVQSPIGEQVKLVGVEPVPLRKRVNIYSVEIVRILNELLRKLRRSLRHSLIECFNSIPPLDPSDATSWPSKDLQWSLPLQLMISLDQLRFTQRVELSLRTSGQQEQCLQKLVEMYEQRFKELASSSGSQESPHVKRWAAISMSVHFVSTLMRLRDQRTESVEDWPWVKLARHYLAPNGQQSEDWQLEVRIASAKFRYKFDYLPIELQQSSDSERMELKRLISTSSSEKCFLIASQAICNFRLGASPFGPAGAGKTETIKALGQLVGCQVIVHNCDESNDAHSLERLVWGLAHTGLWGCFDEFNRLGSGTLSRLSATLELVQSSLRQGRTTLQLADGQIKSLDEDTAFFVTLNPVDANKYRGRRQLPANLRSLFLPISMVCVQVEAIVGEMLLISSYSDEGGRLVVSAEKARVIGRQLSEWLEWMRANCLREPQFKTCEWDLRLIMVILRRFKMLSESHESNSLEQLLVKSIKLELVPRLAVGGQQVALFERGLREVFSTGPTDDVMQMNAVGKLIEQLRTRPGVILVGPSGSGKTRAWKEAAEREGVRWFALNPKSCGKAQLLGCLQSGEAPTRKWQDGLFTKLVREALGLLARSGHARQQIWIVLDGSIDPDWIECLNSVLDDNQVLTLGSGERLNFVQSPSKCIKLIFETVHVMYASPATISRLGLVNFGDDNDRRVENGDDGALAVNYELAFSEFLTLKKGQLLIVYGNSSCMIRRDYIWRSLKPNKELELVEYDCFASTTSAHLLQCLESLPESCCLVLHNLDRVEAEDGWETRTVSEFLRFMLSYGFYYDDQMNKRTLSSKVLLIISAASLSGRPLDNRLLSLASKIELPSSTNEPQKYSQIVEDFPSVEASQSSVVVVERSSLTREDGRRQVRALMEQVAGQHYQLLRFNSVVQVQQSLELISKRLRGDNCSESNSKLLIYIDEMELKFMSRNNKSDLLHSINMLLCRKHRGVKVVYSATISNDHHYVCLTSMAHRSGAELYELRAKRQSLEEEIGSALNSSDRLERDIDPKKLAWLQAKTAEILSDQDESVGSSSSLRGSFVATLVAMISRARENLHSQIKILSGGLDNLGKLDEKIGRVKRAMEEEDRRLVERQRETEEMLERIQMQLRNSKEQQRQIELFSHLLGQKTLEIGRKSQSIDDQLRNVKPLVEASKFEVRKCLKAELLNEIKSLRQPPKVVKDILDVLFILLGQTDNSWASIRTYLTKYSLKDELTNYDFERRLNASVLSKLDDEIARRGDLFSREQAARASNAMVPIVQWIEAARQYGRALLSMEPLSEERARLELESTQIVSSMDELERKQAEINQKVEQDQVGLQRLQRDLAAAQIKSRQIGSALDKAQQVRSNLSGQVDRWQSRLRLFRLLAEQRKTLRLCLLAAYLAILHQSVAPQTREALDRVLNVLEFDKESIEDGKQSILANILSLLEEESAEENLTKFAHAKATELDQLVELLSLRLALMFRSASSLIPLLANSDQMAHSDLGRRLCARQIICDAADQLAIVKPELGIEGAACDPGWLQTAEFAWRSDKVVVFDLQTVQEAFAPIWLEVLNCCDRKGEEKEAKIIIVVNLSILADEAVTAQMSELLCLRPIVGLNVDQSKSSQEIGMKLEELLLEIAEPQLSSTLKGLHAEMQTKQRESKEMEANLIKKLSMKKQTVDSDCSMLEDELVVALSEMHQASLGLNGSIASIESKLKESTQKRGQYSELASEAAKLYVSLFMSSQATLFSSPFCRFTLESYAKLIVNSKGNKLNVEKILATALRPLSGESREAFGRLVVESEVERTAWNGAARRAASLKHSLMELIDELDNENASSLSHSHRLAILLHDSKRSSPQMEVDEVFRQLGGARNGHVRYKKLYASDEKVELVEQRQDLQTELASCLSSSSEAKIACVCIANAHLAPQWLTERLISLIRGANIDNSPKVAQKILVILVAECQYGASSTRDLFDSNLYTAAHLRYWHDELSLHICDRFQVSKSLLGREFEALFLLHVVCQSLTKQQVETSKFNWKNVGDEYGFDHDQLLLAAKILDQTFGTDEFCNHLETVVYGARMESEVDELLLRQIIRTLIRDHHSSRSRLRQFKQFSNEDSEAHIVAQLLSQ